MDLLIARCAGLDVHQFKKLTKDFSASDRSAMFHDTASRVYRLPRA